MYPLHDRTPDETSEPADRGSAQVVSALARAYTLSDTFPLHHPRVREAVQSACAGQSAVGIVALDVTEHGFLAEGRRMDDVTGRLAEFARGLYDAQVEHLRIDGSLSSEAVALFLFCVRQAAANQDVRIADVLACAGAHSIRVAVSDFGAPSAILTQPTPSATLEAGPPVQGGFLETLATPPIVETTTPIIETANQSPSDAFELPYIHDSAPASMDPELDDAPSFKQDGPSLDEPQSDEDWWSAQAPVGDGWREPSASWDTPPAEANHATQDAAEWTDPTEDSAQWQDLPSDSAETWDDSATQAWPAQAADDVTDSFAEHTESLASDTESFATDPQSFDNDLADDGVFSHPEIESGRIEPDLGEPVPLNLEGFKGSRVLPVADPIDHLEPPQAQASEVQEQESQDRESLEQQSLGEPQPTDGNTVAWVDDDLWVTDHWQAEEFRQALLDGAAGEDSLAETSSFAPQLEPTDTSWANFEEEDDPPTPVEETRIVSVPIVDLASEALNVTDLAPAFEPTAQSSRAPEVSGSPEAAPEALWSPAMDYQQSRERTQPAASQQTSAAEAPVRATPAQALVRPAAPVAKVAEVRTHAPATPEAAATPPPTDTPASAAKPAKPTNSAAPARAAVTPAAAKRGVDPVGLEATPSEPEVPQISTLVQAVQDFIASDDRDRPEIEQRILAEVRAATREGPSPVVVDAVETLLYQTPTSDRGADGLAGVMVTDEVVIELMERLGEARDAARRDRLAKVCRRLSADMAPALAEALNAVPPRSVRRNFLNAVCTMGRDALRQAIPMLDDSRWFIVRNGVDIIGEVAEAESVPILFPILGHADNRVRVATVRAMAKIGGEDAQINLTRALDDESQDVREAAAMAVGHLKAERALRPLLELLDKEKDEEFQLVLIRSLGQLGSLDAVSHLEKRATGGLLFRPSKAVRIAAYRALAAIGSPRARQLLVAASEDRDHEVAMAAQSILARMASTAQDGPGKGSPKPREHVHA